MLFSNDRQGPGPDRRNALPRQLQYLQSPQPGPVLGTAAMRMGILRPQPKRHLHRLLLHTSTPYPTQLISNELGQRSNNAQKLVAQKWSFSSKQSRCEYASSSGLKYLDVIGLYSGVEMVDKTFKVDPSS